MKKLIAITVLIIASVTTAQVNAQSKETAFEKELIKFVDSTVSASGKNLTKLDRFKEGCYTHVKVKKFGEADTPYSRSKPHGIYILNADVPYIDPAEFPLELNRKAYSAQIKNVLDKPINTEANYDAYYFTIVKIKGYSYLVFAMGYLDPIDSDERMNNEFKKATEKTN